MFDLGSGYKLWEPYSVATMYLVQGNLKTLFFTIKTNTKPEALILEVWNKATTMSMEQREGEKEERSPGRSSLPEAFL